MFANSLPIVSPYYGNKLYEKTMEKIAFGNCIDGDATTLATMRCLLYPRTKETFSFTYNEARYTLKNAFLPNTLRYCKINKETYNQCDALDAAEKWNKENGIERLCHVEDYIKKILTKDVRIYTRQENNSAVIITTDRSLQLVHLLTSFIPLLFIGLFKDQKLQDDERTLLETLTKRSSNDYLAAISTIAARADFRNEAIKTALLSFEKDNKSEMLKAAERDLQEARNNAERIMQHYFDALNVVNEKVFRYEGLYSIVDQTPESSDLVEYFTDHKNLTLVDLDRNKLRIIINTYLDSFDVDGYEHISKRGDIYKNYHTPKEFADVEDVKLFMNNIFNESPLLKIKLCGYFELDTNGRVTSYRGYNFAPFAECNDSIPNPHLDFHNCLSRNGVLIADQLHRGEIIGAIECCYASVMSVDIHETPQTFRPMMENVFKSKNKIIFNTETGESMTPVKALAWLKENKK